MPGFGQPWRLRAGFIAAATVIVTGARLSTPVRERCQGLPRHERPACRAKVTLGITRFFFFKSSIHVFNVLLLPNT